MASALMLNPGKLPDDARGRRVVVRLVNGSLCGERPVNNDSKLGWAAETTRWTRTGSPFDVVEYRVL